MSDLTPQLPLLVIGAGRMGAAWIQTLAQRRPEAQGAHACGVCDPDPARSGAALPLGDMPVHTCLTRALEETSPAAAIVATPPDTHEDLVESLLRRGLPVLCEKPMAPTLDAARRMHATAAEMETALLLATKFRFVQDLRRAADLLAAGVIGTPVGAEIQFAGRFEVAGGWHADPARSGGGVIADNGPHAVDLARMLLGPVKGCRSFALPRIQDIGVEDSAVLALRHASGALTTINLSWSLAPTGPWYATVRGSQGLLLVGWQESRYKLDDAPDWVVFGAGYDKHQALATMAGALARHLRGEAPYPVDRETALESVRLVEGALADLEEA